MMFHTLKFVKAGPLWFKQATNKLKIRILSQTSKLSSIHYASVILILGVYL